MLPNFIDASMEIGKKIKVVEPDSDVIIPYILFVDLKEKSICKLEEIPYEDYNKHNCPVTLSVHKYGDKKYRFKLNEKGELLKTKNIQSYDIKDKDTGEILVKVRI